MIHDYSSTTQSAHHGRGIVRSVLMAVALLLFLFTQESTEGQITGEGSGYGKTGTSVPYDTAARNQIAELASEPASLQEGPIDPATYMVGPNDGVSVMIFTSRTLQYEMFVSPEGMLAVPGVGVIDTRGKSLSEVEDELHRRASRIFNAESALILRRIRQFKVNVLGAVRNPGAVIATPVTRVSEVIQLAGGTLDRGDRRHIVLKRHQPDGSITTRDIDLLPFYGFGNLDSNPFLSDGDIVHVSIVDRFNVVQIYGEVAAPGEYVWHEGDSIATLIRSANGITVNARRDSIEVASFDENGKIRSRTFHAQLPDGTILNDRPLGVGDRVYVRTRSRFSEASQVAIDGEVLQPGIYPIQPGQDRLLDVLAKSGGFLGDASIADAKLIRRNAEGQRDLYFDFVAAIQSESRTPEETEYFRTKLLENGQQGLMVIDFVKLLQGDESQNILVEADDSIYVPKRVNYVQVSGKVKASGNVLYVAGANYLYYIDRAGGYGWKADKGSTQIIKARTRDQFPASDVTNYILEPGDKIYVPEEQPSDFWGGLTTALTIIAQFATITAVIISFAPRSNSN